MFEAIDGKLRTRFDRSNPTRLSILLALLLSFFLSPLTSMPTHAEEMGEDYSAKHQAFSQGGAKACLKCHESEKIMGILDTPHANPDDPKTPAAEHQCESCHGPSATHMNFPLQVGNIRFSKHDASTDTKARDEACLNCHKTGQQANWKMGPHGFENVACVDCHSLHKSRDPALSSQLQTQQCTEACHKPIISTAPEKSAHPLLGDKRMLCTTCHNPHGPLELSMCSSCHTQSQESFAKQTPKARGYHQRALSEGIACTDCHKAFVHAAPEIVLGNREARPVHAPR